MLKVNNLYKHFSGIVAVNDLSFSVGQGELVGLIGPNGAGKTTVFNLISGVLKPDRGKIIFNNRNVTGRSVHSIASLGLTRTFQHNMLFDDQTCFENVKIASYLYEEKKLFPFTMSLGIDRKKEQLYTDRVDGILRTMGLEDHRDSPAGSLPEGIKRILGVSIAFATEPKIVLLDEPAAGMSMAETENLKKVIYKLIDVGVSILLVEHNVRLVMEICQKVLVVNFGKLIAEGTPEEVMKNRHVIEAYLGK